MKVLHVIGEMGYGGAELLVGEISARLVAAGHRVEVLVLGYCETEVAEALSARGVVVVSLDAHLSSPANVWRIARHIRSSRFDVVHAHLFPALYWVALARLLVGGGPRWLYTEHSTTNGRRNRRILRPLERLAYRRYDHVLCISASVQSSLSSWLGRGDMLLVDNGIDTARFRDARAVDRSEICVEGDMRVLLMVGAFRTEKNHAAMLRALAKLPDRFVLVLAGDGPLRVATESLAKDLGIEARVRFLGVYRNVEGLMKSADICVLPSLFEGFGLSALEACAAGLPVAHSDVAGLSAMLDGAGWPFDPLDPDSISRAILAIESDPAEVRRKQAFGIVIAGRYDIARTVARHVDLYTGGGAC